MGWLRNGSNSSILLSLCCNDSHTERKSKREGGRERKRKREGEGEGGRGRKREKEGEKKGSRDKDKVNKNNALHS